MNLDSGIIGLLNFIFQKIQILFKNLQNNSFFVEKLDSFLLILICLSIVSSLFFENTITLFFVMGSIFMYFLCLCIKQGEKIVLDKYTLCYLIYILAALISCLFSTLIHSSFAGFSKTLLYLFFYFSVLHYLKNNSEKIWILIRFVACCVIFESIVGIFQNNAEFLSISTWQDISNISPELVLTRVYGTMHPFNPNLYGGWLIVSLSFLFISAIDFLLNNKKIWAVIFGIFSICGICSVFMSGCRAAYMALFVMAICFCFMFVLYNKKFNERIFGIIKRFWIGIMSVVVAFITGIILMVPKIANRIMSIFVLRGDSSTSFRFNVYQSAIRMFQDNFLVGIGSGTTTFREVYGLYMLSGYDALSCYSVFLEIAVESGIIGLIAYVSFIFSLLWGGIKKLFSDINEQNFLLICLGLMSLIGVMVHGIFDTIYFRPQIQIVFWISVAIIIVSINNNDIINKKDVV